MATDILIRKESGDLDPYSRYKLEQSLVHSGADLAVAEEIADQIEQELVHGMSTRKIYKRAQALLHKRSVRAAGQYRLKRAIMELGPSGYPFERFITEIFKSQGYTAETGIIMQGHCIQHEVDVLAQKGKVSEMVECKFRNRQGDKIDAKTILYIFGRFIDLKEGTALLKAPIETVWVATNTRFSVDAIDFARCRGMRLLGWDTPKKGSIAQLADRFGLHPLTCLRGLRKAEKESLMAAKYVLCKDIFEDASILDGIVPERNRRRSILDEVRSLCSAAAEMNA